MRFNPSQATSIKIKKYDDGREMGMYWVCRCLDCNEFFKGTKLDDICGECQSKQELDNENDYNTEIINKGLGK